MWIVSVLKKKILTTTSTLNKMFVESVKGKRQCPSLLLQYFVIVTLRLSARRNRQHLNFLKDGRHTAANQFPGRRRTLKIQPNPHRQHWHLHLYWRRNWPRSGGRNLPDVRDIVLCGGCVMIVNGCVITVPPPNHNDTGRRVHIKKGRDNHLPGRGERQWRWKEKL